MQQLELSEQQYDHVARHRSLPLNTKSSANRPTNRSACTYDHRAGVLKEWNKLVAKSKYHVQSFKERAGVSIDNRIMPYQRVSREVVRKIDKDFSWQEPNERPFNATSIFPLYVIELLNARSDCSNYSDFSAWIPRSSRHIKASKKQRKETNISSQCLRETLSALRENGVTIVQLSKEKLARP
jgi:hypothetical protein